MDAYLTLLATKHSMRKHPVMQLHSKFLTSVLSGKFMVDVALGRKKLAFSYDQYADKFQKAALLIGAFNKGGNHWVYIHIDVLNYNFRYFDPKKFPPPFNLIANWNVFWKRFHSEVTQRPVLKEFKLLTLLRPVQGPRDNTNCGLYCLSVLFVFPYDIFLFNRLNSIIHLKNNTL